MSNGSTSGIGSRIPWGTLPRAKPAPANPSATQKTWATKQIRTDFFIRRAGNFGYVIATARTQHTDLPKLIIRFAIRFSIADGAIKIDTPKPEARNVKGQALYDALFSHVEANLPRWLEQTTTIQKASLPLTVAKKPKVDNRLWQNPLTSFPTDLQDAANAAGQYETGTSDESIAVKIETTAVASRSRSRVISPESSLVHGSSHTRTLGFKH
ncbi:MAG: hypothetical protein WC901_04065 [Candidatus Margulisiibacteriota bacterium]